MNSSRNVKGKVIGIYSSFQGQGKSTVADRLVKKHEFRRLPFARLLKRMTETFLVEHGYRNEEAVHYIEVDKEAHLTRVHGAPTARYLMQTIGTDWGRHCIHPEVWVADWELKAGAWSRSGISVVADDLRFPNEVEAIRRLGGKIWRIEKPDAETPTSLSHEHESEGRLNMLDFDRVICNDGTIGHLNKKVDHALNYTRPGTLDL